MTWNSKIMVLLTMRETEHFNLGKEVRKCEMPLNSFVYGHLHVCNAKGTV
jgi:hypothetical protein